MNRTRTQWNWHDWILKRSTIFKWYKYDFVSFISQIKREFVIAHIYIQHICSVFFKIRFSYLVIRYRFSNKWKWRLDLDLGLYRQNVSRFDLSRYIYVNSRFDLNIFFQLTKHYECLWCLSNLLSNFQNKNKLPKKCRNCWVKTYNSSSYSFAYHFHLQTYIAFSKKVYV